MRSANRISTDIDQRNLGLISSGVAFWSMLAIFPGVAAVIAIWGLVADPAIVDEQMQLLQSFLPGDAYDILDSQVTALIVAENSSLGWATLISTGAALWSTRAGVAALIRGLNASYRTDNRIGVRQVLVALVVTAALIGVALTALASIVIAPIILSFVPIIGKAVWLVDALRWGVAIAVMLLGLGVVYRYGPNRRGQRPGWITPGAIVAVLLWAAVSWGFSYYLANFGSYNEVYGALGAAIALLMWFYISAYVILLGAVLNAELENRRERRRSRQTDRAGADAATARSGSCSDR